MDLSIGDYCAQFPVHYVGFTVYRPGIISAIEPYYTDPADRSRDLITAQVEHGDRSVLVAQAHRWEVCLLNGVDCD